MPGQPFIVGCSGKDMSFSLRQVARTGSEISPTSFNLCRVLSVADTGLGGILRPKARKLLGLADECT
ncbi:hypothetical protein PMNALOAF_1840 [Methylobacterium adhaesivum]|nr:hypothetical protein PMNALOAF_1840 [Methylobacterium adhaesivum]